MVPRCGTMGGSPRSALPVPCVAAGLATLLGYGIGLLGLHELIGVALAFVVYAGCILFWMPFTNEEQDLFK
jgi:hypothetical protein